METCQHFSHIHFPASRWIWPGDPAVNRPASAADATAAQSRAEILGEAVHYPNTAICIIQVQVRIDASEFLASAASDPTSSMRISVPSA